jgi:AmmeMemoRadiSam system protein B
VAAHGYSLLRGRRDLTVVLVGPSHRTAFPGVSLWARGAFDTPLGRLPIDEELATALLSGGRVSDAPEPHLAEHSLEMQLPFLAHLVEGLRIVPLLMGSQDRDAVEALAEDLARAAGSREDVMLTASSDLSHYHPASIANELDARVVDRVAGYDDDGLMETLEANHEHACGGGPMVCVMKAARALGADTATVLRYADSGDEVAHDKSRVVGYLSAALSRTAA